MAAGSCRICGQHQRHREHGEREHERRDVGEQHLAARGGAQVHQRLRRAQLAPAPHQQHDHGRTEETEGQAAGPAPVGTLGDRQQQAHQRRRQPGRADEVEPPAGAHVRLRHRDGSTSAVTTTPSPADGPEQHVPVGVLGEQRRRGQAERAADAERGAHHRGRRAEPFGRQLVTHDADPQRDHAGREALQRPADDHRHQAVAERRDDRADDQQDEADQQHPPLAVHVAEPPHDGVATAPASSVAVITQAVSAGGGVEQRGQLGISGMTSVCISETTMPPSASTTTTRLGRGFVRAGWDIRVLRSRVQCDCEQI